MPITSLITQLRTIKKNTNHTRNVIDVKKSINTSSVDFQEDPFIAYPLLKPLPIDYVVMGIDGSRSLQDHHTGIPFALILIANSCITYGSKKNYSQTSEASIYHVINEYGAEEEAREKQLAAECTMAKNFLEQKKDNAYPTIILLDGSIVKENSIPVINDHHTLCAAATYTSAPRHYCISRNHQIADSTLFLSILKSQTRTAWFKKNAIYVCYFSTGKEIVRIETSLKNNQQRELLMTCIAEQCRKGGGYPLVLHYAHHYAGVIACMKKICSAQLSRKPSLKHISKQ